MVNTLAPANALYDSALLVLAVRRNQDRDRLADNLFGSIAEEPLNPGIPSRSTERYC
jgi:hypothetical protein